MYAITTDRVFGGAVAEFRGRADLQAARHTLVLPTRVDAIEFDPPSRKRTVKFGVLVVSAAGAILGLGLLVNRVVDAGASITAPAIAATVVTETVIDSSAQDLVLALAATSPNRSEDLTAATAPKDAPRVVPPTTVAKPAVSQDITARSLIYQGE